VAFALYELMRTEGYVAAGGVTSGVVRTLCGIPGGDGASPEQCLVVGHDDSSPAFERLMGNAQHAFCQNFTRQLTSNAFCVCAYDESIPRLE